MDSQAAWTPERRETFGALADILIPRSGDMPSAREAGLAGPLLDRLSRSRLDLAAALAPLLDELARVDPAAAVARLERERPDALLRLLEAAAGGYYMSAEVRRLIGYPGQEALTLSRGGFGGEDLVEAVMARGPIHRVPERD